jgi:hypothetical protein
VVLPLVSLSLVFPSMIEKTGRNGVVFAKKIKEAGPDKFGLSIVFFKQT